MTEEQCADHGWMYQLMMSATPVKDPNLKKVLKYVCMLFFF
jgi:hypothetical protein